MIRYYFKTAWRTLLKDKVNTVINILGLTVGICACMLVTTVVLDEVSYDTHWKHVDNLYRIVSVHPDNIGGSQKTGAGYARLAPELKRNFPEVQDYSELYIRKAKKIDLSWLIETYNKYPDKEIFFDSKQSKEIVVFEKLAGGTTLEEQIVAGLTEDEIRASWEPGLREYKKMREKYLIYP